MRFVATDTSLLHRTVLELCFGNGITNIFVTIKAEFIPPFQKNELVLGGMRVVAFYAIAFHYYPMDAFWILRHNPFMALIADFVRIFVQQFPVGSSMSIMAFRAFSRLHGSMDKWVFELFLERIMTFKTEFPLGAGFQLEFVLLPIS